MLKLKQLVFNSAEKDNSSSSPQSEIERSLKYPEFRIAPNFEGSVIHHHYMYNLGLGKNTGILQRVVSALSRFGPGSFRPGSFRPELFWPWVVLANFGGLFRPDFFQPYGSYLW